MNYTTLQAAHLLGMTSRRLETAIRRGMLEARTYADGSVRVTRTAVQMFAVERGILLRGMA